METLFFGDSRDCSNEPTQQGALPLRGERRGTLTARPWCWSAEPAGARAGGTEWRRAGGGSQNVRAPTPACRQPGWFSCGPWRTWPLDTDSQPPGRKTQKNVTSALGVRRKVICLSCSKTHRVCDFLPPPALSAGNTEGFPLWEVWTHGGAESLRSPKYPDTTQRLRYPAADWSLTRKTGRRDNRSNQLLNTLLLKILQTILNNYKICFY